jgi:adenylate kinase family enzyme
MSFILLLAGTTGTGKSSIAKMIFERNKGWRYVESGGIARSLATKEDLEDFKNGKIMADERLIRWQCLNAINRINYMFINDEYKGKTPTNIVLDGFPRTPPQLEFLFAADVQVNMIIGLKVTERIMLDRIEKRKRDEIDTAETAKNRYAVESGLIKSLMYEAARFGIRQEMIDTDYLSQEDIYNAVTRMLRGLGVL